jgi:hypothetical protein
MSTDVESPKPWNAVLRVAARRTLSALPWVWVAAMVPVVVEGAWKVRTIGRVTLIALAIVPIVFAVAVFVQRVPWTSHKAR